MDTTPWQRLPINIISINQERAKFMSNRRGCPPVRVECTYVSNQCTLGWNYFFIINNESLVILALFIINFKYRQEKKSYSSQIQLLSLCHSKEPTKKKQWL